jgi:AbrB family looped-hinge helix DNA binding protein
MHEGLAVGSTTVGAKGQVVLPVSIRRRCDISPGDTLIVMARPGPGGWSVMLMKSSALAGMMEHMEKTGRKLRSLVKKADATRSGAIGKPGKTGVSKRRGDR